MKARSKKILVHCCCAPDAVYCLKYIKDEGIYSPEAYFYNPNIFPQEEYQKRLANMEKVCTTLEIPLRTGEYDHAVFEKVAGNFPDEPEGGYRCALCYDFRLEATARKAREIDFKAFSAILTISPHKSADLVSYFGRRSAEGNGVEFIFYDFKKKGGFQESVRLSKELGLYRQNYCGCEFSVRD